VPLSLRARLVLGVVALALAGFAAADAATYSALRSYLVSQADSSLEHARAAVEAVRDRRALADAVPGYYLEVRRPDGSVLFSRIAASYTGDDAPSPPRWPSATHGSFTVPSHTEDYRYRVHAWQEERSGDVFLLALSLHDADETLHHLLVVEILVTGIALVALALLSLVVVHLGLRPLAAIGRTAAAIAGGDLGRRVEREDERTEIGRLGRSLNAMLEQIEEGYRAKTESERKLRRFVADASHELRTPLSAVRAYAELFERGASTRPADLERSMRGIERESERMSRLVDDLLLLARLDEGLPLRQDTVRLDAVAAEAVEAARAVDRSRPVELAAEPVEVTGDGDRLRQAIDNLLANARAHTPAGTRVYVSVAEDAGSVVLRVSDEGPGLAAGDAAHVFERFWRADVSRARASGGVGLGLAIVSGIARAHGGAATAEPSTVGATFALTLPARND
jgi:two-component system OmpR family sensor kinase